MSLFGPPDVRALRDKGDIKGLIRALNYQKDPNIAHEAVQALGVLASGGTRDSRASEALIAILTAQGHGDQTLRHFAVQWLGSMGDARAVEVLIAALADGAPNMRCVAAGSLGRMAEDGIRDTRVVAPLVSALGDTDHGVRAIAARALELFGWQPENSRAGVVYCVELHKWDQLLEIGAPAVEPLSDVVAELVAERDSLAADVQLVAERDRRKPQDSAGVKSERENAIRILGELGAEPAFELLLDALRALRYDAQSSDSIVRDYKLVSAAVEALTRIAQRTGRSLVPILSDGALSDGSREVAIEVFVRTGGEPERDALAAATKDGSARLRELAAVALAELGDARAVEPLIGALKGESGDVQLAAAIGLAELGDARAVEPLLRFVGSPHTPPRAAAVQALIKLNDEEAIDQALKTLAARGAIELLATLDFLGASDHLLRCLFQGPLEMSGLARIGEARPFGDWTETVLRASGYQEFVVESATLEGSALGSDEISRVRWAYATQSGDEAVAWLCTSRTPIATNILHLVADKPDQVVVVKQETFGNTLHETLSFAYQRLCARDELVARGNPAYNAELYLQEGVWDMPPALAASLPGASSGVQ